MNRQILVIKTAATLKQMRALLVLTMTLSLGLPAFGLTLVDGGRSDYQVLIAKQAPDSVREAARELVRYIEKSTEARLEIVSDIHRKGKYVVIGNHPEFNKYMPTKPLPHDGYIMKVVGDDLLLMGKDEEAQEDGYQHGWNYKQSDPETFYVTRRWRKSLSAGSYNAVIEFLRENVGVRWYMPGPLGEEVPQLTTLKVPGNLDQRHEPTLKTRWFFFADLSFSEVAEVKRERGAFRGTNSPLFESGQWSRRLRHTNSQVLANSHGWREWIPADQIAAPWIAEPAGIVEPYGEKHPEWFALRGGTRENYYTTAAQHNGMLCTSNRQMRAQYAKNIIAHAEEIPSIRNFGLSANDGGHFCECAPCRAQDPPKSDWPAAAHATYSGYLTDRTLHFQKDVAQQVLKKVPDARFQIMTYHSSAVPPVRESVPDYFDFQAYFNYWPYRHLIPKDRELVEYSLRGWAELTDHFYLSTFYFAYGNYGLPWSTPSQIEWLADLTRETTPKGWKIYMTTKSGQPMLGAFGPDLWVMSQLAWDVSQDLDALYDEYFLGCYGDAAGPYVRAFYGAIDKAMTRETVNTPDFRSSRAQNQMQIAVAGMRAVREEAAGLIAQAVKAAASQDERYQWRVAQAANNWRYVEMTLDALDATRRSQLESTPETVAAAVEISQQRRRFMEAPENWYAVSAHAFDTSSGVARMNIIEEAPKITTPRVVLPYTTNVPAIGGDSRDLQWSSGVLSLGGGRNTFFDNIAQIRADPAVAPQANVIYGDRGIYFRVWCQESPEDMANMRIVRDPSEIYRGESFELYLSPDGVMDSFYQFILNPLGDTHTIAGRGDQGVNARELPFEHASYKWSNGWGAETFVPWKALGLKQAPDPGETWRMNLYRNRSLDAKTQHMAWTPTGGSYRQVGMFGFITFGER